LSSVDGTAFGLPPAARRVARSDSPLSSRRLASIAMLGGAT
jgi:hypothetical protein